VAYRGLFRHAPDEGTVSDIQLALNQSQPLGNERFYATIEGMTQAAARRETAGSAAVRECCCRGSSPGAGRVEVVKSISTLAPFTGIWLEETAHLGVPDMSPRALFVRSQQAPIPR